MLGLDYFTSSALFKCACDTQTVDIVSAVFKAEGAAAEAAKHAGDGSTSSVGGGGGSSGGGSGGDGSAAVSGDDVEVFGNGQLVYKEPMGGHLVNFHQDAAFFEFSGVGPVGKHPLDLRPCVCAPGGVPWLCVCLRRSISYFGNRMSPSHHLKIYARSVRTRELTRK